MQINKSMILTFSIFFILLIELTTINATDNTTAIDTQNTNINTQTNLINKQIDTVSATTTTNNTTKNNNIKSNTLKESTTENINTNNIEKPTNKNNNQNTNIQTTNIINKKEENNNINLITNKQTQIKTTPNYNWYVNTTGGGNGKSYDSPTTLTNAFTNVQTNESIFIKDGTYNITNTITINKNLTITGQSQNYTIISGQNTYQIFNITKETTITINNITLTKGNSTRAGGAIYNRGNLSLFNSILFDNYAYYAAGAIYNELAYYNIENCTITNNTALNDDATSYGGAIANINSVGVINNSLFISNYATNWGGAIYNYGNLTLTNTLLENNTAVTYAGAIFNELAYYDIENCTFIDNSVLTYNILNGGLVNRRSEGIVDNCYFNSHYGTINSGITCFLYNRLYLTNSIFTNNKGNYSCVYLENSFSMIDNCLFVNDTSKIVGGALNLYNSDVTINNTEFINNSVLNHEGGAIYSVNSTLNLINSNFENNSASYGGAICYLDGSITVDNVSFLNNKADKYDGGAIYAIYPTTEITSTKFINNTANDNGGAIYIQTFNQYYITNSTFLDNLATNGGAIYTLRSSYQIRGNVFVNNENNTVYSVDDYLSNLDDNWWGQNNPNFTNITQGITPDTWITMTFTNTTRINSTIGLNITLNTLNTGETSTYILPEREIIFNADTGTFTNNTLPITDQTNNTYNGNSSEVYATIDNQTLKLSDKITPTITTKNIQTYYNSTITINAKVNNDATGLACIKINGKTIKTNITVQNGIITYIYKIPTNWKNTNYLITIKYSGNNKYTNNTTNTTLTLIQNITQNNITQNNITITPIQKETNETKITIPEKYDLRDYGLVTPVKNQGGSGSCSEFAFYGALESALLKQYNITYDFSENNMKNIISKYSLEGLNTNINNDGTLDISAISYLVSWLGPINETVDPYADLSLISPILNSTIHIQDIIYIPSRSNATDNNQIKEAILKYGAIISMMYMDNSLYNSNTNAYYYTGDISSNHEVAIVGWDDNYDKSNFLITPPGNGAYIVKNSWGTDYNNGYFYISYYDTTIANYNYAFVLNNTEDYLNNYQYEHIDGINIMSYDSKEIWIANQYTATTKENIAAFSTYFDIKTNYTAYIYVNNQLQYTQNGTIKDPGYRTVQLDKYIPLNKNDTFKVELKLTSITNDNILVLTAGYSNYENSNSLNLITKANQSFISKNGIDWEDLHYNTNPSVACLKVYTVQTPNMTTTTNSTNTKPGDTITITTKINDTNIKIGKIIFKLNGITLKDTNGTPIKTNLINGTAIINYTIPKNLSKTNYTLTTLLVTPDKRIEQNTTLTLQK